MQRMMITGGPGSGKSTLARKLGEVTGLPVTHIDQIAWLPDWEERPKEQTAEIMLGIQAGERWIIDGNYSMSIEDREQRADTIIFGDIPIWIRLFRLLKRIKTYRGIARPDMADNCPERFDWEFFKWTWDMRKRHQRNGIARLERCQNSKRCFHIQSDKDIELLLKEAKRSKIGECE